MTFADWADNAKVAVGTVLPFLYDAKGILRKRQEDERLLRDAVDLMRQDGWKTFDSFLQLRETLAEQEILALSRGKGKEAELFAAHARRDEIQALRQFGKILPREWEAHKDEIKKLLTHIADTQPSDETR